MVVELARTFGRAVVHSGPTTLNAFGRTGVGTTVRADSTEKEEEREEGREEGREDGASFG